MTATFNDAADLRKRGFQLRTAPVTILCVDPSGDGDDFDGVIALSREEHQRGEPHDPDFAVEFVYRVILANRLPKDKEFPDKLAMIFRLDSLLKSWTVSGRQSGHVIGVETNGVGYGYASSLARKTNTKIIPYATVARVNPGTRPPGNSKIAMPRLDALDNLRILMETGYLKLATGAPGIDLLRNEMNAFVWRGRNRPEAMQGQKDDLVMALTGAAWIGSKVLPPLLKQVKLPGNRRAPAGARMRMH